MTPTTVGSSIAPMNSTRWVWAAIVLVSGAVAQATEPAPERSREGPAHERPASVGRAPLLAGTWQADARLLNRAWREKTGALPSVLTLSADGRLSGRIGDVAIPDSMPKRRRADRLDYEIVMPAPPAARGGIDRTHLVVMIGLRPDAAPDIDFHLKSRFGFDPGMFVGHFDLVARPAP